MFEVLPELLTGAVVTVKIMLLASALAICLAILAGLGRMSKNKSISWFCVIYIEFFRGTALLVQLFWLFFVLASLLSAVIYIGFEELSFSPFDSTVLGLHDLQNHLVN